MCYNKDKGFTIIELIITIVIVAILAFVGVPVYRNYVKERLYYGRKIFTRGN